jgi:hypothetical protein
VTATSCPHCGHRSSAASSGLSGGAICVVVAGALIGFAAFLPWETVLGVGMNGFDVGTAGVWTVCIGLLVGLPGLTQMNGRGIGSGTRLLALLGGLAAIGLAILGWAQVHKQTLDYGVVSVGVGIFMVAIGGGLAVGTALVAQRRSA